MKELLTPKEKKKSRILFFRHVQGNTKKLLDIKDLIR